MALQRDCDAVSMFLDGTDPRVDRIASQMERQRYPGIADRAREVGLFRTVGDLQFEQWHAIETSTRPESSRERLIRAATDMGQRVSLRSSPYSGAHRCEAVATCPASEMRAD
jgi:hypothetical protein